MTDGWHRKAVTVHAAGVCATAPPGMAGYGDKVQGWIRWGVLILLAVAVLVSIGAILAGRIFHAPHASRGGAIGLAVTVICAILLVTAVAVVGGIAGSGCG